MPKVSSPFSESFERCADGVARTVTVGSLSARSVVQVQGQSASPHDDWDRAILHGAKPDNSRLTTSGKEFVIGDLFCGAGGLSVGVRDACMAVGLKPSFAFGADQDQDALAVYSRNLHASSLLHKSISSLVDYAVDGQADSASFVYPPDVLEENLSPWVGKVDVLVAGPPCQGHSNLNNKTRREDPRNLLYLTVPALAVALGASAVIIENVPDVRQDSQSVFATTASLLRSEGYVVDHILMNANALGVPQTRKRLFLVGTRGPQLELKSAYRAFNRPERTIMFAIADLLDIVDGDFFDSTANVDPVSQSRIDYLFDHELYELPNTMRPDCHKDGHSYPSVYGRLREASPAGTITQGFNVIGRGRFIHPLRRRPITPHEAARLQGFPDSFEWHQANGLPWSRSTYAKLIGNAVPPVMGFVAMMAVLQSLSVGGKAGP